MFVAKKVIFQESELVSLTSVTEIGFNDFPEMEDLTLRQNPIETEDREHFIDGLIVPSDQSASHESVSQQLKHENESRRSDSEAEKKMPQGEKIRKSLGTNKKSSWYECLLTAEGSE